MSNYVALGGVILTSDDGVDGARVVTNLVGWDDAPAARTGLQSRMQQDGAWDASGTSSERVIDISGRVHQATPTAAYAMQRQLAALRPQSVQEFVVVHDWIGSLSATVRITAGVKVVWVGDRSFSYDLQATAPDPAKYGPATFGTVSLSSATPGAGLVYPEAYPLNYGLPAGTTAGAITVGNAGTQTYWPRLRIDGPVTNPVVKLVESGAWVRYGATLVAGQWLDFDLGLRRVLLQGQVSVRASVSFYGDWLAVQPGGGSITWVADNADPAAKLSVWGREGAYQ